MSGSAINPYESPIVETPRTLGIKTPELISYFFLTSVQCTAATWLHTFWMSNPKSNMTKVLDDPWDWLAAGVAYCLLFLILNLCAVRMRRVRNDDLPGIGNYLRLAALFMVLLVAAVFAIFGFVMAFGSPQASYFMWSLSGLTLLSLPWNWTRSAFGSA